MLKYYLKNVQESNVLYSQLIKQGMTFNGSFPVWNGKDQNTEYITICPVDRTFKYDIDYGTGGITIPFYTLCDSVTEVLKRLWNTWVDKPKGGTKIFYANNTYSFPTESVTFSYVVTKVGQHLVKD